MKSEDEQKIARAKEIEMIKANWQKREHKLALFTFLTFAIIFFSFAVSFSVLYVDEREVYISYSEDQACTNQTSCLVNFSVDPGLPQPVYLYYELTQFYQNFQTYFDSLSEQQIQGKIIDKKEAGIKCGLKADENNELRYKDPISGNATLNPTDVAYPCGFIALTRFNGKIILMKTLFPLKKSLTMRLLTLFQFNRRDYLGQAIEKPSRTPKLPKCKD